MFLPKSLRRPAPRGQALLVFLLLLLTAIAGSAAHPTGAATAPSPVAAYSFDAGSGTTVADASGNGNTGTLVGASWTTGKYGSALAFNGSSARVSIPDAPALDFTNGMTLEAWVKPSALGSSWRTAIFKQRPNGAAYSLYAHNGAGPDGQVYLTGERDAVGKSLATGVWTHLASTFDGSTVRLYVNGTLAASQAAAGALAVSSGPLTIGGNSIWSEWFAGSIDDVRLYSQPLSQAQVVADMQTRVGGTAPAPPPADTQAPTAPTGLSVSSATQTSVTLAWSASTDNTGVTGYGRYVNGSLASSGTGTTATMTGLACGVNYTFAVDAYDAAANRSAKATVSGATAACATPPPADTQAPTAPTGLSVSSATQTSVTLAWSASTDNVGVSGYGRYVNGSLASSGTGTTATMTGLACGVTYTFAVDAYDAAANRSAKATVSGATSACPTGGATANIWVDSNGGSCTRSSSLVGYADAQACSWANAYAAARTGDLVLVKGGDYGTVSISSNNTALAAPGVTFRPATGETVSMSSFENGYYTGGGSNMTLEGPVKTTMFRSDGGSNIVVDGWTVDCGGCLNVQTFHLEQASNVIVRNSDISDNSDNSLMWINGTNLTFENNRIHDAGLRSGSGAHTECMYAWDVTGLTLKRNHFYHCSVMDVFITGAAVSSGGYVENNVFERPWESTGNISQTALSFHFRNGGDPSPDPTNWDFRYNTFVGPLSISDENPVGSGGMRVIGNVFLSDAPCGKSNTTYDANAFVSGACGTHAITNTLATFNAGFTAPGDNGDYSLKSGSVLRDQGSTSVYPATDLAGLARPVGGAPDIGAFEGR